MYSDVGKVCRTTAASLSNELSLFLCDVSGTMIKKFHEFDDDLSGELSKEEFEIMMDHLRKQENFKLSRQDADLLFWLLTTTNRGVSPHEKFVKICLNATTVARPTFSANACCPES